LLERVVAAIPGSFDGWNALAMACVRQGDLDAAIAAWERARQINPDAVELLFNLGLVHAQAGHLVEAIGSFEAFAERAEPGPQRERALALAQRLRARASQER
ncbi:MAG TPA: tetratricopeptide repeat protein, partial [Chondromyces sp.]|nr:tetratricopeptide repeat protein [Chondromyces sp.]